MTTINPEKLALLDQIDLDQGAHGNFDEGHCAMEVVSWLADEASPTPLLRLPVLARYTIAPQRPMERRAPPGAQAVPAPHGRHRRRRQGPARERIAAEYVAHRLLVPWLRLAGLDDEADAWSPRSARPRCVAALRVASDAAWRLRSQAIST